MGRPKKQNTDESSSVASYTTLQCICCNNKLKESEFYSSSNISPVFSNIKKIPVCKNCMVRLYEHYVDLYKVNHYKEPEKKAIIRLCMLFDIYYSDKILKTAYERSETKDKSLITAYFSIAALNQNREKKNYDTTLLSENFNEAELGLNVEDLKTIDPNIANFFGDGLGSVEDYLYLQEQYDDWTARHECNTKAQEETFKQICFTQLELLRARRSKQDTKDLNTTLLKQLEAANLQPKQNSKDATSDAQTFGTLIDKWENTRPIPEIDDDLKDVDKIGLYIDTFFKGHLAKMMGIKNGFSNLYTRFIKKYTVEKPEYDNEDENSEALFDTIFGGGLNDE